MISKLRETSHYIEVLPAYDIAIVPFLAVRKALALSQGVKKKHSTSPLSEEKTLQPENSDQPSILNKNKNVSLLDDPISQQSL